MNEADAINDRDDSEPKRRKPRKRSEDRRVFVYRVIEGKPKEQGSFPEATIGSPIERRLPMFLREFFGAGDYKVETRKATGHFEQSFDFSIADEFEPESGGPVIDVDAEEYEFSGKPERFAFEQNSSPMNSTEVENLLLKERLKRIEDDYHGRR